MKQDTLGRLAIGISVACVVGVGATIAALTSPAIRSTLGLMPIAPASYVRGERIDVPASLYETSPHTLVLFARSDCGACQHIKPWLAQTIGTLEQKTGTRVVMVATNARLDDEIAYAAEIGLARDRVVPLASTSLKVRQVPTLVLVDRQGSVLYSLDGAPNIPATDVISRIATLTESR